MGWTKLTVLLLACAAAAPATGPTTQPTGPDLAALVERVRQAEEAAAAARAAAVANAQATPEFRAAAADMAAKQKALEQARASGTPQQRLDASSAYNRVRVKVERLSTAAAGDPSVKRAETDLADARAALARGQDQAKQLAAAADQAAEAERMKDPVYRGMKEGKVVVGMTLEQANKAMKKEGVLAAQHEGGEELYEWWTDIIVEPRGRATNSRRYFWARVVKSKVTDCGRY